MKVGNVEYEWIDGWAQVPESPAARSGWAHHGIVATASGELVTYHPGDPVALVFDAMGKLLRSWKTDLTESHGMSLAVDGATEVVWVADPGAKRDPKIGYVYPPGARKGQVVKFGLDGKVLQRLSRPDIDEYRTGVYSPTTVVAFHDGMGGNGDVWVGDGYGMNLVHRYSRNGDYLATISGSEGTAGPFSCPHGLLIDHRKPERELYVADRTNKRIQVYDLEGKFKRAFGSEFLSSPSAFAVDGDRLLVAELRARVAVLDISDRFVGYLGANEEVCSGEGWPNAKSTGGELIRPAGLRPGRFNSPHGIAVDGHGDIYVVEWLIGGRYSKLTRKR